MRPVKTFLMFGAAAAAGALLVLILSSELTSDPGTPATNVEPAGLYYPDPDSFLVNFEGYLWPTDVSRKITSSFAEYRSFHFHAGIDISTGGTTGHNVYSVEDGYVYRIRITPNGYGKMLYIRHPDGYISTYAHLQSFSESIDSAARREQYRTGQYEIDLFPGKSDITVRRGDVIAHTGDTGFGPPHLHFEIRDTNLNPVNPLLGNSFRMHDEISPTIYRLVARPLTAGSFVNDKNKPRFITRFSGRKGNYRLGEKIRIEGEIGFGVETRDRSNGVGGRTGVHTLELLIDSVSLFRAELNALPILKTKQIYLHYDLPLIRDGKGRFQKLYVETGNELPFYTTASAGSGIIDSRGMTEGEHSFTVRCTDIYGNESLLHGTIVVNHAPRVELLEADEEMIRLLIASGSPIGTVIVDGKKQYAPGWKRHTVKDDRFERNGDTITVPVDSRRYDILKIVATSSTGSRSRPMFHVHKKETGPTHRLFIDTEIMGNDLVITITSAGVFTDVPRVVISGGKRSAVVTMTAYDVSGYRGFIRLPDENAAGRTIHVEAEVNGTPVTGEKSYEIYSIPPDRSGSMLIGDEGLVVSYDSGAVFTPLHFTVTRESRNNRQEYVFNPQDILLNRGISISVPAPDPDRKGKRAVYFRSNQGWTFEATEDPDAHGRYRAFLSSTLGELSVMEDSIPPSIGYLRIRTAGRKPTVSFRYSDNLSGVAFRNSSVTIDDSLVIPEIDGEHRRVRYIARTRLGRGKHTLRISYADRLDNRTVIERSFTIR